MYAANDLFIADAQGIPCKFFGSEAGCQFGDICHYSHEMPSSVQMCKNFQSASGCFYGERCHYRHQEYKSDEIKKMQEKISSVQCIPVKKTLDDNESIPICTFYNGKESSCMRGIYCKFRHVTKDDGQENEDKNDEETEEAVGDVLTI